MIQGLNFYAKYVLQSAKLFSQTLIWMLFVENIQLLSLSSICKIHLTSYRFWTYFPMFEYLHIFNIFQFSVASFNHFVLFYFIMITFKVCLCKCLYLNNIVRKILMTNIFPFDHWAHFISLCFLNMLDIEYK